MKHVVITGGSDGIGLALAKSLIKNYNLTIIARSTDKLTNIANQLDCNFITCDIQDAQQVQKAFNEIAAKHESVDVLINNAGIIVNGDLTETPYETIAAVIGTNATGTIFVTKACLEIMKKQKSGLIINIISTAGITAKPNRSIYNASKWALTGFTKAIQEEAGAYGVRITGLYPGTVKTDLFKKAGLPINGLALETDQIVQAVHFVMNTNDNVLIPELGIRPFDVSPTPST